VWKTPFRKSGHIPVSCHFNTLWYYVVYALQKQTLYIYNLIFLYICFLCLVNIKLSINRSRHYLYIYCLLNSAVVYIIWLNFRYACAKMVFQFETVLKLFYAGLLKIIKFYPSMLLDHQVIVFCIPGIWIINPITNLYTWNILKLHTVFGEI